MKSALFATRAGPAWASVDAFAADEARPAKAHENDNGFQATSSTVSACPPRQWPCLCRMNTPQRLRTALAAPAAKVRCLAAVFGRCARQKWVSN